MVYRSQIVIGVHKEIVARDLISPEIPKALHQEKPEKAVGDFFYWNLDWKWYTSDPDVKAIIAWFHKLADEDNERAMAGTIENRYYPRFGAIQMGEAGNDVVEWGSPSELEIFSVHHVAFPTQEST